MERGRGQARKRAGRGGTITGQVNKGGQKGAAGEGLEDTHTFTRASTHTHTEKAQAAYVQVEVSTDTSRAVSSGKELSGRI